ncbi:substrate-binding periplasmic protein [Pseudoalteromonas sp. T1lg65]|uniref:substrate-binding periplasmic protein n=1 Tax=Pseudoalteromonas sp. T1lg65 TaxID=2077101 RepID=UPI003F79E5D8
MKKLSRLLLIAVLISCSSLGCEITVRFESYAMQTVPDEVPTSHGLDVDFAKALLREANCQHRFVSVPWGRGIQLLKKGKIDLMLSVSKTPEREVYIHFIGPQRNENIVFAMNRQFQYNIDSLEALFHLPYPIVIHKGAFYGKAFAERLEQRKEHDTQFIAMPDNQTKLSLLNTGRLAGFLEEKYNIMYQQEHNPEFSNIVISPYIIHQNPVYFAFSKESVSERQLKLFEQAFERLKSSGKLKEILKKYKLD